VKQQQARSFHSSVARALRRAGLTMGAPAWAATAAAALLLAAAGAAEADPRRDDRSLRRHGSVARLLWVPEGASLRLEGQYVSAGIVLGTRGPIRSALGPVAPALVFDLGHRSNLTLLSAGGRGAMLVWQHRL
jgi:hypothetical protein